MVRTRSGNSFWEDPNKKMETVIIDKKIKEDFSKFAKENHINKSKLIEDFYKSILLKSMGLNTSQGYVTINIFNSLIPSKKLK
jgi:hypothetical protein